MKGNKTTIVSLILAAIATMAMLASCSLGENSMSGGGGFKDVKGVHPVDADKYILLNNVDGYPNLVILCYSGVALTTTTRDAQGSAIRVPEFDNECPGYAAPPAR